MKSVVLALVASFAISMPAPAGAAPLPSSCPGEYVGNVAPDLRNPKLSERLREVCFSQFGVFHSGITATPLFVGQRLTPDIVKRAKLVDRTDVFHVEASLPPSERSELAHYRGSGLDRGHMAPAADMASNSANDESFSLANMIPQYPKLNRKYWADIEETTRRLASQYGEVFVVTGPVFSGARLSRIGGRVIVPSAVYKAVFIPRTGQSSAWWADNSDAGGMEVISIATLSSRIGADVFPSVSAQSKAQVVSLPLPKGVIAPAEVVEAKTPAASQAADKPADVTAEAPSEQSWGDFVIALLLDLIEAVIRLLLRG